jgi:signal transduction histidine kinase
LSFPQTFYCSQLYNGTGRNFDDFNPASCLAVVGDDKKFYGVLSQDKLVETLQHFQEEKYNAYEKRISVSERIKEEFIKSISHEIRPPLNAIQGLSEILIYSDIPEADKGNYPGLLHAKTDELLSVVESLLNLSQLKAGDFNISVSDNIDPNAVCENLI